MKKIISMIVFMWAVTLVGCTTTQSIERLKTPSNLEFSDNTLTFDKVDHATSYIIIGEGIDITITTNSYTFQTEGLYKVRVAAKAANYLDSLFSKQIEILVVGDEPIVDIPDRLSAPENLRFSNNTLTFDVVYGATSYLISGLEDDVVVTTNSYTFTKDGIYFISVLAMAEDEEDSLLSEEIEVIVVFEDSNPFIIYHQNMKSDLENDTVIIFEMAGYKFNTLSGQDLTKDDYNFKDNQLTIKVSYIRKAFINNSDSPIILSYVFEKTDPNNGPGQTYLGFLTITK